MEVTIDLNFLAENDLYPNEYVYLYSKYKQASLPFKGMKVNIKRLEELGYLKIVSDDHGNPKSTVLRQKFIDLVEGDVDRMFAELVGTYPMKVGNPGNYRVLHAADPSAKANAKAKDRYRKIVEKDPQLHSKIIRLLKVQLENQREKLQYMQMLEVWINNRTWEKWDGFKIEQDESRNTRVFN
jgi:hypothetical protein